MSILRVTRMGHPVLRQKAHPIPPERLADPRVQRLVGIGADVTVLNFGSVTFKPENGPEIKQDIGDLLINKGNRVRFGIRFRF